MQKNSCFSTPLGNYAQQIFYYTFFVLFFQFQSPTIRNGTYGIRRKLSLIPGYFFFRGECPGQTVSFNYTTGRGVIERTTINCVCCVPLVFLSVNFNKTTRQIARIFSFRKGEVFGLVSIQGI